MRCDWGPQSAFLEREVSSGVLLLHLPLLFGHILTNYDSTAKVLKKKTLLNFERLAPDIVLHLRYGTLMSTTKKKKKAPYHG